MVSVGTNRRNENTKKKLDMKKYFMQKRLDVARESSAKRRQKRRGKELNHVRDTTKSSATRQWKIHGKGESRLGDDQVKTGEKQLLNGIKEADNVEKKI